MKHFLGSKIQFTISKGKSPQSGRDFANTWVLTILVVAGCVALGYFLSWWFVGGRLNSPYLWVWLIAASLYAGVQLFGNWILYLGAYQKARPGPAFSDLTVDVFVTAYREPYVMIEQSLAAACAMRSAHRTWLLDDGSDPALAAMAERYNAGYLTREDHRNAKAGNLNAALPRTNGDIIVIFDTDHVPEPDFLEKSLGYFNDPEVGFVQVMVTFGNSKESWVAKAAMETSLEFYNPTYRGMDVVGGATMMGSNALIRRKALEAINGYQPGLAEDLATSIALHAAGWKSAYVAEPLAPGQAPPSFTAWFVQQLKWSRGVFELLLTAFPRLFHKLTWGQRLSYAVRMTKYWIGPVIGLHLFFTIVVLMFATSAFRSAFHEYLIHLAPLIGCDVLIRFFALRMWLHPSSPKTTFTRAVYLIYATWPIYMMAWIMAILRLPLSFRPTPKSRKGFRLNPIWLLPQVITLVLLTAGTLYTVFIGGHPLSLLLMFAILQAFIQLVIFSQWLWSEVQIGEDIPRYLRALKSQFQSVGIIRREVDGRIRTYLTDLPFTIDPLPLDGIEKAINILDRSRRQERSVFVLGESETNLLAGMFACELAKDNSFTRMSIYQVLDSGMGEQTSLYRNGEQLYNITSILELPNHILPGDVLVCITASGVNKKLKAAIIQASKVKARTILFTGMANEQDKCPVDALIKIPGDSQEQVEDGLLILQHIVSKALREIKNGGRSGLDINKTPVVVIETTERPPLSGGTTNRDLEYPRMTIPIRAKALFEGLVDLHRGEDLAILPEFLLRRALENILQFLGASGGSLVMFDEFGEASRAAIAYDGKVSLFPAEHLMDTLQSGLAGWVVAQRQPALVTDTRRDPRWLRRSWDEMPTSRSAISSPIMNQGRVIGVVTLVHRRPGRFTDTDLTLLVAIAASLRSTRIKQDRRNNVREVPIIVG